MSLPDCSLFKAPFWQVKSPPPAWSVDSLFLRIPTISCIKTGVWSSSSIYFLLCCSQQIVTHIRIQSISFFQKTYQLELHICFILLRLLKGWAENTPELVSWTFFAVKRLDLCLDAWAYTCAQEQKFRYTSQTFLKAVYQVYFGIGTSTFSQVWTELLSARSFPWVGWVATILKSIDRGTSNLQKILKRRFKSVWTTRSSNW